MLITFDAPDSNTTCPRRERSNTPLQALALLNDTTLFECAQTLGQTLASQSGSREQVIAGAFKRCLGREAVPEEFTRIKEYFDQQPANIQWVALARTLMNLDEFITRE